MDDGWVEQVGRNIQARLDRHRKINANEKGAKGEGEEVVKVQNPDALLLARAEAVEEIGRAHV